MTPKAPGSDTPSEYATRGSPSFIALLREIAPEDADAIDVATEAGVAFRCFYDAWVRKGGYRRGKPRRSVRQVKIWLGKDNEVRSLETKLTGKTLFQIDDVKNLLNIILNYWSYDEKNKKSRPHPDYYGERVAYLIADELFSFLRDETINGLRLPIRKRQSFNEIDVNGSADHDDTLDSQDAIEDLYRESDTLITVSRERTFIGTEPESIMLNFQEMLDRLRAIDKLDDRFRALIWIVDSGQFEHDRRSQAVLHNLEFLATQFRALILTDHPERDARAEWFQERAVVLVGTLRPSLIDPFYLDAGYDLPEPDHDKDWVNPDRLLLDGTPDPWIDRLGREGSNTISQRTITVHRDITQLVAQATDRVGRTDLRFLLHAPLRWRERQSSDEAQSVRCVELPRPGPRWGDAFRLAHEVALLRLDRPISPSLPYTALEGLKFLRDHRFAVLNLMEFCELTNRLIFGVKSITTRTRNPY